MAPKVAPYGTWTSPLEPADFAAGSVSLQQVHVNESSGKIYLLEIRPHERGRGAIIEYYNGAARDVLPAEYNALSQVHEYGGASMLPKPDGNIIFTDFETKGVYELNPETEDVRPVVEEDRKIYYADFTANGKWAVCIKENHHPEKIEDIENTLVAIDTSTKGVFPVAQGCDFYAFPRFSPDGQKICWVSWNHPAMPWTETELWVADWQDGDVTNPQCIAGKETKSSVTQPMWGLDGSLFFVDDRTGFWQLYQMKPNAGIRHIKIEGLEDAEFAGPDWFLGCQWYAQMTTETLLAFYNRDGTHTAILIEIKSGKYRDLGFPINQVYFNSLKRLDWCHVAVIGATATAPASFFLLDTSQADGIQTLKSSTDVHFSASYLSRARNIKFPRIHGPGGGHAYGIYHPPTNPRFQGPDGSLPPLVVAMHGGPTWQDGMGVYMRDQFWTTRGYALVQVNYVGSAGFGREYVKLLDGQWGVSDIADAASCVDYLAKEGLIDRKRVGITGHSSGGYATMQALCMYPDVWMAGIAESGISDVDLLFKEIHKFESQYLQPLCFQPAQSDEEDRARIVKERSPIYHIEKIKAPLLILTGGDDNIVPPNQANLMAEKLRQGGGVVDLCVYPGEGHIFQKGTTLEDMEVRREAWFRKYLVGDS